MIEEEYTLNNGAILQMFEGGKNDGPILLITPGGGYFTLTDNEGTCVAEKFSEYGFRSFVLRYATVETQNPCGAKIALEDMTVAMKLIREKYIDVPVFLMGFSAGGHLCASFANTWRKKEEELELPYGTLKPSGTVLCYPALSFEKIFHLNEEDDLRKNMKKKIIAFQNLVRKGLSGKENVVIDWDEYNEIQKVNSDTVASFVWGTMEDELIAPETLYQYQAALHKFGTECVVTLFESGAHGLSLATKQSAYNDTMINDDVATWVEAAVKWMKGIA